MKKTVLILKANIYIIIFTIFFKYATKVYIASLTFSLFLVLIFSIHTSKKTSIDVVNALETFASTGAIDIVVVDSESTYLLGLITQ